jgi:hypothetical protein
MKQAKWAVFFVLATIVFALAGCGGGGGGGGGTATVSGVAAAGAPLVGTVYLKDSSQPPRELSDAINADGSFSFNVDGMKPPFILKAQGTAGGATYTLYSFASGAGVANINPFANLAVAVAAGDANLAALYTTPSAATMQAIAAALARSTTDIQTKLLPLFTLYKATANPISGNCPANHLGLDGVMDMVKVTLAANGTVTLINKQNNAVIYTGSISNFLNGTFSESNIPQPPVVVNVTPATITVNTSGTATFTAAVSNTTNPQVTWSIVEAGGGTITPAGVYTAPSSIGTATTKTYTVKATSVADPTKFDIATVTVTTGPVVTISPTSATLITNETKAFTANVTNSTNTQVTWSVVEAGGGTITPAGVYKAPATAGTYHVKATSAADPTKSATATITVNGVTVTISPASASVTAGGTKSFSATVTGTSNTQVTWSVVEGASGGAITSSGTYSAPAATGTYHVKSTSVADPTKSATATVTVTTAPQPWPIGTWVGPNGFKFTVSQLIISGAANQYSGIIYYPSLTGGSMNVSGTDSMMQILGSSYPSINLSSLSVIAGQTAPPNFTTIEVGLNGPLYFTTSNGTMTITSSNSAYNYLNMNAIFTKQ